MILSLCSALVRHTGSAGSGAGPPSERERWTYWTESDKGLRSRDWSISHRRRGEMDCPDWRREGSVGYH